jgi:hypothetical protein
MYLMKPTKDDEEENERLKRRSDRIKSKGFKSMQVLITKLDENQLPQLKVHS